MKVTILILLAALMMAGCTATPDGEQARREANTAADRARADAEAARLAARKALESRITELQKRLDVMKAEAKPTTEKARHNIESELDAMRAKLSTESGRQETWDKFKANTEDALKKLETKLDDLGSGRK